MPPVQSKQRPPYRPKKRHVPDSRTKFDIWLDEHLESGEKVEFVFKADPEGHVSGPVTREVKILTVDRYMIYVEVWALDGEMKDFWKPVWIAKDNIISAS